MNKHFIAGAARAVLHGIEKVVPVGPQNVETATSICRDLAGRGVSSTLGCFYNHETVPQDIVREHRKASSLLRNYQDGTFYLSLKPWQLHFDPELIAAVAKTAVPNTHGISFDSLRDDMVEQSFELLERAMERNAPATIPHNRWQYGITLPSRWKRSLEDADRAAEDGLRVRVVKGEVPAADRSAEVDPREGFLGLVERVAGRVPEIEIATHDYAVAK
ncbi:MAG: hypothetical protein M3220_12170, partial [Chloroflexota bacterium]|nr:hypothetical protein [Chloroflexota bacterium]